MEIKYTALPGKVTYTFRYETLIEAVHTRLAEINHNINPDDAREPNLLIPWDEELDPALLKFAASSAADRLASALATASGQSVHTSQTTGICLQLPAVTEHLLCSLGHTMRTCLLCYMLAGKIPDTAAGPPGNGVAPLRKEYAARGDAALLSVKESILFVEQLTCDPCLSPRVHKLPLP